MNKIKQAAGLVTTIGFLAGLSFQTVAQADTLAQQKPQGDTSDVSTLMRVTVIRLGEVAKPMMQSVPARVVSLNDVSLSTEITATVTAIKANVGDQVAKGDVLATLDCRDYAATLKQAKAGLSGTRAQIGATNARADAAQARMVSAKTRIASSKAQADLAQVQLKRASDLVKRQLVSRDAFDQAQSSFNAANSSYQAAQTDLNAARADWEAAKADVIAIEASIPSGEAQVDSARLATARCTLTAPFAGQITQRSLQQGQLATPGTPAFQLLQTDDLEISAQLTVAEVRDQVLGAKTHFMANGQSVALERRAVIGQVTGSSRTQEVRFNPVQAGQNTPALLVGATGRVTWQGKLPALSADWLVQRGGVLGVMLAVDGKAKFHAFPEAKEGLPMLTDLPADTRLIDANRLRVRDGQAITTQAVTDGGA